MDDREHEGAHARRGPESADRPQPAVEQPSEEHFLCHGRIDDGDNEDHDDLERIGIAGQRRRDRVACLSDVLSQQARQTQ